MPAHVTIPDQTPRVQYTVGSLTTAFAVPFPFFDAGDLVVYAGSSVIASSAYTVSGTAADGGYSSGTVTLDTGVSSITVTIVRDVPIARTTDFPEVGAFSTRTLNTQLDKVFAILQQQELADTLALSLNVTTSGSVTAELPVPVAGRAIKWNSTATGFTNSDADPDTVAAAASISAAAAATSASAAATSASGASTSATTAAAQASIATVQASAASSVASVIAAAGSSIVTVIQGTGSSIETVIRATGSSIVSAVQAAGSVQTALAAAQASIATAAAAQASIASAGYTTFAASGGTISGDINMVDNDLVRPRLQDYALTTQSLGTITSGTSTINVELGNAVFAHIGGSITFAFQNPPASGTFGGIMLELTNGGAFTVTWPASVSWHKGTQPTLESSGVDILGFVTRNGGTTWRGYRIYEQT